MQTTPAQQNQFLTEQSYVKDNVALRDSFLQKHSISSDRLSVVGHDAARRKCYRAQQEGRSVILVDSVPDNHPLAVPGHKISDFVRIGSYLSGLGVNVPDIYDVDEVNGFLLVQDFGDVHFKVAAQGEGGQPFYYGVATDVLRHIRDSFKMNDNEASPYILPSYYESHVHQGRCRVVDWYLPLVKKEKNKDGMREAYLSVWDTIEAGLPPCPQGFCHIDYHFENLMWIPNETGLQRCGVLDFQGAMMGPSMYDIANLLEDARIKVPDEIKTEMLDRYCAAMKAEEREAFDAWYRVIATQFHCRVIGQFIRLAVIDGKTGYLDYIPLLQSYLTESLSHPLLKPLSLWFDDVKLDLSGGFGLELTSFQDYIRSDAF